MTVIRALVFVVVLAGSDGPSVRANPSNPKVQAGSATISQSGNRLDVRQTSSRAIIDWRDFSIAAGEVTRFQQPSADAIALNRVSGGEASLILGNLQANGQVWLINPNGVAFGAGARVDVGGLVAATADIRDRDFLSGRFLFDRRSTIDGAAVENRGRITVADTGYAALVAPDVRNSGVIEARLGRVTLGGADAFALDLYGDRLVSFRVDDRSFRSAADGSVPLVFNAGRIQADGGTVAMVAQDIGRVVRSVVNTEGIVQANAVERRGGGVVIGVEGVGETRVVGTVSARGGSVAVAGGTVTVDRGAALDAGDGRGGGQVQVRATGDATIRGARLAAGRVRVAADTDRRGRTTDRPTGGDATLDDATVDAGTRQDGGRGGSVEVTGDRVAVLGNTRVDASGAAGGGSIKVGGDYRGQGDTRTAEAAVVATTATLSADALRFGWGGRVIVWADGTTRFHGRIFARGGADGGDGGFVETSGRDILEASGTADASAPRGTAGMWLLDPGSVTISSGATDGGRLSNGSPNIFTPDLSSATVSAGAIEAGLNQGTSVTIATGTDTTSDITVNAAITKTAGGLATLQLSAGDDIVVNQPISATNGPVNVELLAGDTVTVASAITSRNGDVTLHGNEVDIVAGGSVNSGTGVARLRSATTGRAIGLGGGSDSTPGALDLADAELDRITTAAGGRIIITGDGAGSDVTLQGPVTLTNTDTLHITTGGAIAQADAGSVSVANLRLTSQSRIGDASLPLSIDATTLAALSAGGVSITDTANGLAVGTVISASGVTASNGGVLIRAQGGNLTVGQPVTATAGSVSLVTDQTFTNNSTIRAATSGDIGIVANKMTLAAASTIRPDLGSVWLYSGTPGQAIRLGPSSDDAVNTLELSNAELNSVINPLLLKVGAGDAGDITLANPIDLDSVNALHLVTHGTITNASDLANTLTVTDLALAADTGIGTALTPLSLDVTNLAAGTTSGGIRILDLAGGLTITPVAGLTGLLGGSGDVVVRSNAGLTISAPVSGAAVDLDAAVGSDVVLTGSGGLTAASGPLHLDDRLSLGGGAYTVQSSTGDVTLANVANAAGSLASGLTVAAAGTVTLTDVDVGETGSFTATAATIAGITRLRAGTASLNGSVRAAGLQVGALTVTGPSAVLAGAVAGLSGSDAAMRTDMANDASHLVNGCPKGGCEGTPSPSPSPSDPTSPTPSDPTSPTPTPTQPTSPTPSQPTTPTRPTSPTPSQPPTQPPSPTPTQPPSRPPTQPTSQPPAPPSQPPVRVDSVIRSVTVVQAALPTTSSPSGAGARVGGGASFGGVPGRFESGTVTGPTSGMAAPATGADGAAPAGTGSTIGDSSPAGSPTSGSDTPEAVVTDSGTMGGDVADGMPSVSPADSPKMRQGETTVAKSSDSPGSSGSSPASSSPAEAASASSAAPAIVVPPDPLQSATFGDSLGALMERISQGDLDQSQVMRLAEQLGDEKLSGLTQDLLEVLSDFDRSASPAVPGDAFQGVAQAVVPGLVAFQPRMAAAGNGERQSDVDPDLVYQPGGFPVFQ